MTTSTRALNLKSPFWRHTTGVQAQLAHTLDLPNFLSGCSVLHSIGRLDFQTSSLKRDSTVGQPDHC